MTLNCLTEDVSLGDLYLNRLDPDTGVQWLLTDMEGWWTLPENEMQDVPRGWDDGSYDTGGRYASRVITVTGIILPPNPTLLPAARAELFTALDLCRRSAWLITRESYRTIGSVVRLSGQPLIATNAASGKTEFSFGLRAPDPVKYSLNGGAPPGWYTATIPPNSSAVITDEGNYQVFPTFTVHGPTSGPVLINNTTEDTSMVIQSLIPAGSNLVIDVKNRSVSMVTGSTTERNKRQYLRWDTDWPALWPGANTIYVAGGATVDVQWRHGWIA